MPDLDILCELFRKEAMIALEESHYGKKVVTLSEQKCDDHKGYSVVINNMPEDAVVIKGDAFPSPSTIFSNSRGECKRAYDYRFVSIRDIAINKKPTRISSLNGLHDSPERMLKINSPHHLQFKQLVGAL